MDVLVRCCGHHIAEQLEAYVAFAFGKSGVVGVAGVGGVEDMTGNKAVVDVVAASWVHHDIQDDVMARDERGFGPLFGSADLAWICCVEGHQILESSRRLTSHAPMVQPMPMKKPHRNQIRIWIRERIMPPALSVA